MSNNLQIKRVNDSRVVKCVLHRVADIPGGVTVKTSNLGGTGLFEGTPLGKGSDGLFTVCKTAQIITTAAAAATSYDVAKGHHFKVGDRFATADCNGQLITAIDKSGADKDVITLGKTLGAEVQAGTCAFESSGENKTLAVTPVAVAGSNEDVRGGDNLFTSAWVIAVIRESNAPVVDASIKAALKTVAYV